MTSVAPVVRAGYAKRQTEKRKEQKKKTKTKRKRQPGKKRRKGACLRDVAFAGHHAYVTLREGPCTRSQYDPRGHSTSSASSYSSTSLPWTFVNFVPPVSARRCPLSMGGTRREGEHSSNPLVRVASVRRKDVGVVNAGRDSRVTPALMKIDRYREILFQWRRNDMFWRILFQFKSERDRMRKHTIEIRYRCNEEVVS